VKKLADRANRAVVNRAKLTTQHKAYVWLPWVCILFLFAAFVWTCLHPNGKTFDIVCNLIIAVGVILIASGAVVQPDMRERLYTIKDYDPTKKGKNGVAPYPPKRLSDAEVAKFFIDASDNSEAGTLLATFGTCGLVIHLIVDLLLG
jgi:hypothetical protein